MLHKQAPACRAPQRVTHMPTDADIIRQMDRMEKSLHELASRPASRHSPGQVFGGWQPRSPSEWPVEQLKKLGGGYTQASLDCMLRKANGRPRVTGMGPYLCKVAGLAAKSVAHAGTLQILRDQGLWDDQYEQYGPQALQKEFGSHAASAQLVVKGYNGREVTKAALSENSGQTGGYLIPPQFQNELLTIAAEDGFIEQRAKVVPMQSKTVTWPMLDITTNQGSGASPYFGGIVGNWQPEASVISETEPAFRQSEWTAWDLVLYTVSSNQLLADNGIGLDALLTQLFGAAITWYKEFAYLQGKGAGSSMPLGVMNAPASILQNRNTSSRFLLADAAAMLSHLHVRSWDDACWIMHQSVIPQLIQMVGGGTVGTPSTTNIPGNQLVWLSTYTGRPEGPLAMRLPNAFLNGLPIFFTEKTAQLGTKGDVILADWGRYVIGMRLDIQIDVSPHYLFRTNQLAWRVIARLDGRPWLNNAITDQTGWQVSPFIILN